MKISQSLPRPENWQDFESLCKKLWGEIWNCPEIKKNGRAGNDQAGIDVYGIPQGDDFYYGIQCKGKDEYTHKQLTAKEINTEIEKAKKFEPGLRKMYFATTALKNTKVETLIRKKNIEHRKQGIFEVHIYSWEDIVDLIFENRSTYDYYLNSHTFKKSQSVKVSFMNGETEMVVQPKFVQKIRISRTRYEEQEQQAKKLMPPIFPNWEEKIWKKYGILDMSNSSIKPKTEFNRSFIESTLLITNTGSEPIEHWKLVLTLPKEIIEASHENFEKKGTYFLHMPTTNFIYDTYINTEHHLIEIEPIKKILVGDDDFNTDPIFLKPIAKNISLTLNWKLVSKNYKEKGILTLHIQPDIETRRIKVDDDSPLLLKENKRVTIEDYLEVVED